MNFYRTMVSQDEINTWMLVISPAILLFSVTYFISVRPLTVREMEQQDTTPMKFVDWRLGILIVVGLQTGLVVLQVGDALSYWGGLITAMLPLFSILVYLEFLQQTRGRYLIPVLLIQAGFGALSGARSAVVFTLFSLLAVLARYGVRINWRALIPLAVAGAIVAFSISAMRAEVGRFVFATQTGEERVQSLFVGFRSLFIDGISPSMAEDFVYRFDGNAFPGMVASAYQREYTSTGWNLISNNFLLVVPSFLNPNKLEAGRLNLNEEDYLVDWFGMPAYQTSPLTGQITGDLVDYISTTWGILFGAVGIVGIMVAGLVMGWLFAVLDNWLMRSRSLFSVLCGIGLTGMVIGLEQGTRIYFVQFRSVVALYLLIAALSGVRRKIDLRPLRRRALPLSSH